MPSDYAKLKADNIRRYGEDIGRIGPMLLAHRYDNRAHFIFELLQNAEDALSRRAAAGKVREVTFSLTPTGLSISHFGEPFTSQDVQYICGIGESTATHGLTDIGRFGIGFKSVYAFTDRPEIHSGDENFAIEAYVRPCSITPFVVVPGQTVFRFPFRPGDASAYTQVYEGLAKLDLTTLLFLREIEQINWETLDGMGGTYLRETKRQDPKSIAREVTIIGHPKGQPLKSADFLVVERAVTNKGNRAGQVEIAYQVQGGRVVPVENATLSVFFPTIVPTRFGAILQGPFRTTPSRDNIPRDDAWNRHLVGEMAVLLADSLSELKSRRMLGAEALNALPIHSVRFPSGELFRPLYESTIAALKSRPLLPGLDGAHYCAAESRLGRTKEIRELFTAKQLGSLWGGSKPIHWISDAVTENRMPDLRNYLIVDLGINELDPQAIATQISEKFLATQSNAWIVRFYEFLNGQESLWRYGGLNGKALIRLSDGKHVVPFVNRQPNAFLPTTLQTGFPTVHPDLCASVSAVQFLKKLGLTEPDPVDDVIQNLLPRYTESLAISATDYAADLTRIITASRTNLSNQRTRLIEHLRVTPFVRAQDAGTGKPGFIKPTAAYFPTQRLKSLFEGVTGVWFADILFGGQKFEDMRDILRACGCEEYLTPVPIETIFSWEELLEMRRNAGYARNTGTDAIYDKTFRGLDTVLSHIAKLPFEESRTRAALLWEALCDAENQKSKEAFSGQYLWFYGSHRNCSFDAASVRTLNRASWIPKIDGTLAPPEAVIFEDIDPNWPGNAFLLSKIHFKPRAVVELAKLVGVEPGFLDHLLERLRKLGISTEEGLNQLLGEQERESALAKEKIDPKTPAGAITDLLGGAPDPTTAVGEPSDEFAPGAGADGGASPGGVGKSGTHASRRGSGSGGDGHRGGTHSGGSGSSRPAFHTYVAVSADDAPEDPEGLDHAARMQIEEIAIAYILKLEPALKPTSANNPGFDLFEGDAIEGATRFIEVKSRRGSWSGPVALSRTQFHKAQEEGERFWLYVVENTAKPDSIRLHAIKDPAGKAHHFCFDPGWSALATP